MSRSSQRGAAGCLDVNEQMQMLSARLKAVEKQVSSTSQLNSVQTFVNYLAFIIAKPASAALLLANPQLALQIAAGLGGLPSGALGTIMSALPGDVCQKFLSDMAIANLNVPAFGSIPGIGGLSPEQDAMDRLSDCVPGSSTSLRLSK